VRITPDSERPSQSRVTTRDGVAGPGVIQQRREAGPVVTGAGQINAAAGVAGLLALPAGHAAAPPLPSAMRKKAAGRL